MDDFADTTAVVSAEIDDNCAADTKHNVIGTDTDMPETNTTSCETDLKKLDPHTIDNVTSNDTTNPEMLLDDTNIEQLVITPAIVSGSPFDRNDYDLIDIFQNQIYANYKTWNAMMDGTALILDFNDEYQDKNAVTEYFRIRNIQDHDTFCELTDAVFSHAFQENTIYPKYLDYICPLFVSFNDRLYYNYNTGGCVAYIIDFSTAEIVDRTDESFNVSVVVSTHYTTERFTYQLVNQDGHWVMDNDYWYK